MRSGVIVFFYAFSAVAALFLVYSIYEYMTVSPVLVERVREDLDLTCERRGIDCSKYSGPVEVRGGWRHHEYHWMSDRDETCILGLVEFFPLNMDFWFWCDEAARER